MSTVSEVLLDKMQVQWYYNYLSGIWETQGGANGAALVQLAAYQPSSLSVIPLTADASGNLNVTGGGGGGSGSNAAAGLTGSAVPGSADYTGWNLAGNLVGVSLTNALPIQPGTGATFPVTGTFWQATQPVSGTFWQATQPVSGTVGVNNFPASQAVTGTFWQATQPVSGTVGVNNFPASQAVTGTFWQATQPVSAASLPLPTGAATAAKQPALGIAGTASADVISVQGVASMTALKVDGSAVTQPVSGTFWQATQPVSGTVTANQGTANTAANAWPAKVTDGTNTAAVKAASTAAAATDPALVVAVSPNNSVAVTGTVTVTPPTLTKGTQGATGFSVQDLKDAGRNQTNYFMAAQVVSTATETLQSLTGYKGGVAVAATTTPAVVTAAKTYRLQTITITYVGIITTVGAIQVNLRANLSGVALVTSPLVCSWLVGEQLTGTAVAGDATTVTIPLPDGMEFAAGTGIGITVLGVGVTGTATAVGYAKISLTGYEY